MKKLLFNGLATLAFTASCFGSNEIVFDKKHLSNKKKPFKRTMVTKDKYGAAKTKTFEATNKEKKVSVLECTEMFQKIIISADQQNIKVTSFRSTC